MYTLFLHNITSHYSQIFFVPVIALVVSYTKIMIVMSRYVVCIPNQSRKFCSGAKSLLLIIIKINKFLGGLQIYNIQTTLRRTGQMQARRRA